MHLYEFFINARKLQSGMQSDYCKTSACKPLKIVIAHQTHKMVLFMQIRIDQFKH